MPAYTPLHLTNQNLNQRLNKNFTNLLLLVQISSGSKMDNQINQMYKLFRIFSKVTKHFYEIYEEFPDLVQIF